MPPVMLIPGNMCDERLWQPVGHRLAYAGHRICYAPRLDQPSIAAMADAVEDALDEPAILVGFSMGAIVATEVARRAPERAKALVAERAKRRKLRALSN